MASKGPRQSSYRLIPAVYDVVLLPSLNALHGCFELILCSLIHLVLQNGTLSSAPCQDAFHHTVLRASILLHD